MSPKLVSISVTAAFCVENFFMDVKVDVVMFFEVIGIKDLIASRGILC